MRRFCLLLAAMSAATSAQAETIRVELWHPADSDQAAALRSVLVEPFGGSSGADLTVQIEDALRAVDLGQGPWLRVIPAATGSGGEALLRGTASTEQRFADFTEQHERCIKDGEGKCTSEMEKITVKCYRRHIDLIVALRLIDRQGTLLWSDNGSESYEDKHCEDAKTTSMTRQAVARNLSARVAWRVRTAFAPRRGVEDVRVDEGRKGLSKADGNTFKAAVRSVKDHQLGNACTAWTGLAATYPDHVPTRYNLGLCAESSGDDRTTAGHYDWVLARNPKHALAQGGLVRISDRARTFSQIAAHDAD